jgi:MFS family permease
MISKSVRARLVVVLAFASTGFTVGTVNYSFGLFVQPLTDWSSERQLGPDGEGWTRTSINLSVTLTFLTYSVLGPAVGWAVDRYGPRRVAPLSLLSVAGGYLIFAAAESLVELYVGSVVMALGVGGATQASTGKLVAKWFPMKKGQVMGIVTSGNKCAACPGSVPILQS